MESEVSHRPSNDSLHPTRDPVKLTVPASFGRTNGARCFDIA
jgi:hypothetical protein